jgi:predicted DNA-binding protein
MNAKCTFTMYCTPAMKKKLQALAKRSGCSVNYLVEACFRMAIQCFDGKTSDLIKMLAQLDAKPTKKRDSIPVTVRLPPEVYEGLQRLHGRTRAATRARLRRQKRR